jgi:hypothetical protein
MATFTVHRKATIWESQTIEAESFDDAIEATYDSKFDWVEVDDTYEASDSFWVRNEDTEEDRTFN